MTNKGQVRGSFVGVCRHVTQAALALVVVFVFVTRPVEAQTYAETVLYNFAGGNKDGAQPMGKLTQDKGGNLYGTTQSGGIGEGTVFVVTPTGRERVLYSFVDEYWPDAGVLAYPSAAKLYGTTYGGGTYGWGTVFELDPRTGQKTTVHSFNGGADGAGPQDGNLIADAAGNLYGTTPYGGGYDQGTVFKLDATGQFTVLHTFSGGADGGWPYGGLLRDAKGNLYGTTWQGGTFNKGTVFKLTPAGTIDLLHSFTGNDGANSYATLMQDSSGNLYGTTVGGGAYGYGAAYKLNTKTRQYTLLYSFTNGEDGSYPMAGLLLDKGGNLYGTTEAGGDVTACVISDTVGCGTVFKLDASGQFTVLHRFTGSDGDGAWPWYGALISDQAGNLYGTTLGGGAYGDGTVFKLTPN